MNNSCCVRIAVEITKQAEDAVCVRKRYGPIRPTPFVLPIRLRVQVADLVPPILHAIRFKKSSVTNAVLVRFLV